MKVSYFTKVTEFIISLSNELKGEVTSLVNVLNESEKPLAMPYSKSLGKGLFELRTAGEIKVRVFYCFHKNVAYLLHGIVKKTQKTPKKEIDFARKMHKIVESL